MSNKTLNMIYKLNNSSSSSNLGAFYNSDYEDYPALEQSVNIQVGNHYQSGWVFRIHRGKMKVRSVQHSPSSNVVLNFKWTKNMCRERFCFKRTITIIKGSIINCGVVTLFSYIESAQFDIFTLLPVWWLSVVSRNWWKWKHILENPNVHVVVHLGVKMADTLRFTAKVDMVDFWV